MGRSGADFPVGSRSQEGGTRIPACICEFCESNRKKSVELNSHIKVKGLELRVQIDNPFGANVFRKNLRAQAGMRGIPSETSTDMDVGEELTGMYSQRVSEGIPRSAAFGWH